MSTCSVSSGKSVKSKKKIKNLFKKRRKNLQNDKDMMMFDIYSINLVILSISKYNTVYFCVRKKKERLFQKKNVLLSCKWISHLNAYASPLSIVLIV